MWQSGSLMLPKITQFGSPVCQRSCFFLCRTVHVDVKDSLSLRTLSTILSRLRSVEQSSSALMGEKHFERFNLKSLC